MQQANAHKPWNLDKLLSATPQRRCRPGRRLSCLLKERFLLHAKQVQASVCLPFLSAGLLLSFLTSSQFSSALVWPDKGVRRCAPPPVPAARPEFITFVSSCLLTLPADRKSSHALFSLVFLPCRAGALAPLYAFFPKFPPLETGTGFAGLLGTLIFVFPPRNAVPSFVTLAHFCPSSSFFPLLLLQKQSRARRHRRALSRGLQAIGTREIEWRLGSVAGPSSCCSCSTLGLLVCLSVCTYTLSAEQGLKVSVCATRPRTYVWACPVTPPVNFIVSLYLSVALHCFSLVFFWCVDLKYLVSSVRQVNIHHTGGKRALFFVLGKEEQFSGPEAASAGLPVAPTSVLSGSRLFSGAAESFPNISFLRLLLSSSYEALPSSCKAST